MREPAEYGNNQVPIPVFYVLEIYEGTFRQEKPVVEIHTAEPLSSISVGDYLYEVSFPDPLAVPPGHILQVAAKQHVISTHAKDQVTHITKVKSGSHSGGALFKWREIPFGLTRK
jgi:hypothetical protein